MVGEGLRALVKALLERTKIGHRVRRHKVKPIYRPHLGRLYIGHKIIFLPIGLFGMPVRIRNFVAERAGHYCSTCKKRI